jgi:hypothetical protein
VRRVIAQLFLNLGTRRGCVVSITPQPPLPPRKTRYPLYRRLGGPPEPVWIGAENLAPLGFYPRTFQLVASRYTNWAIPAPIGVQLVSDYLLRLSLDGKLTVLSTVTWSRHVARGQTVMFSSCLAETDGDLHCIWVSDEILWAKYIQDVIITPFYCSWLSIFIVQSCLLPHSGLFAVCNRVQICWQTLCPVRITNVGERQDGETRCHKIFLSFIFLLWSKG